MDLVINKVVIRQNEAGLYSINDLHKAAGGTHVKKPVIFFRNHGVKAFVKELEKVTQSHLLINRIQGRNGGTWVDELLVYKYAAWIDAEFDVRVFRTFQALSKGDHDKAQAIMSNNKSQLLMIAKRDRIMSSKIPSGKKADKLTLLEREWVSIGTKAGRALAIRRGETFKFIQAQDQLVNEIQIGFEF